MIGNMINKSLKIIDLIINVKKMLAIFNHVTISGPTTFAIPSRK